MEFDRYNKSGVVTKKEFSNFQESITIDILNLKDKLKAICPHKRVYRANSYRYYTCMVCGEIIFKADLPENCEKFNLMNENEESNKLLTTDEYVTLKKLAMKESKKE